MMKVDEARSLLATMSFQYTVPNQAFANESLIPAFEAGSDADKAKMIDAAEALVVDGDDADKNRGAAFLELVPAPAGLWPRFVAAYAARNRDDSDPLATLLGNSWPFLDDPSIDELERIFLAHPERQLHIARAVLHKRPDGPSWDALCAVGKASGDPEQLWLVKRGMNEIHRFDEFIALMRSKPVALQKVMAKWLFPSPEYNKYVAALGLQLD